MACYRIFPCKVEIFPQDLIYLVGIMVNTFIGVFVVRFQSTL